MLVGNPPYYDESPFRIYEKILEGNPKFPKWIDSRAKDLVKKFLIKESAQRLGGGDRGIAEIKSHAYFGGIDWDVLLEKNVPAPIPIKVGKAGDSRYYDRYADSPEGQLKALTATQQESFRAFCG